MVTGKDALPPSRGRLSRYENGEAFSPAAPPYRHSFVLGERPEWFLEVKASLERAQRIARRLGLHRVFHEIGTFVQTEADVLLAAALAQAEIFLERMREDAASPRSELLQTIAALQKRLRVKSHTLHQLPCTPHTTVKRAELIRSYATTASRILCLGDDDFVSVALAWLLPNEITVLDLDPDVLSLIEATAAQHHLRIRCRRADLRRPIPEDLREAYDIVITDPIYAVPEMVLFLSAAAACLRKRPTSYLFTGGSRALAGRSWAQIEEWATAHRLTLEAFFPGFNAYPKTRRVQILLGVVERLFIRSPLVRACLRLPYLYSDYFVFRFHGDAPAEGRSPS
jgi:hypothetical protein